MTAYGGSLESGAEALAEAIRRSVASSVEGVRKVAVAFSGGVDSSVLVVCARERSDVVACTAFSDGALDESKAAEAARALGVELAVTKLTPELVRKNLGGMDLPFEATLMDKSLWSLYSAVADEAARAGAGVILLGQLSDELFGGYSKYAAALEREGEAAATSMMDRDVAEYAVRGRVRDWLACSRWLPPRLPFESAEVVALAASFPLSFKIRDGVRKAVLRRAAIILGVPEEVAAAPKKAAQYSSGIQKLLA